ncbi:nitroreductase family protein [Candidatus Bipolaricaulota bacterium]|nr:nitroreductase family protein [Candidatus Bipolaricaulota bacterium]
MAQITIDEKACVRCGKCVDVCAIAHVFELSNDSSVPVRPEACWNCGQCVAGCPTDAIDHETFPLEDCPIIEKAERPTQDALVAGFRMRRSQRVFQESPIDREVIRDLVSLGRWAPTASNSQSVDWLAFDDPSRIDELSQGTVDEMSRFVRLAHNPLIRFVMPLIIGRSGTRQLRHASGLIERLQSARNRGDDPIFYRAPVVLIGHCPTRNRFGRDDAVFAAYNMMLVAESFGLATCQIGFFQIVVEKSGRLLKRLGLPNGRSPQIALVVGHPRHTFRRGVPRRSPNLTWNNR